MSTCALQESERIIFASVRDGSQDIYLIERDGSQLLKLTDNNIENSGPVPSPDGERFLYLSRLGESGTFEIMIGHFDREITAVQLTSDYYDEQHASWSPNGDYICFSRNVNGSEDIWVMDERGEKQEPITTNPADDSQPEWSPKGGWITYISHSPFEERQISQVCIIKSDGTEKKELTSSATLKSFPGWLSDGSSVYFLEYASGNESVCRLKTINRSGQEEKILLDFDERIEYPGFSNDDKTLLYTIAGKGTREELFLYDMLAGREIRLTDNSFRDFSPRWVR